MEQFSHDLSLALEETSRVRTGRWTARRRTRSTGNLPCAPQPTEDSSSSPEDGTILFHQNGPRDHPTAVRIDGQSHGLSDSDNAATATGAASHFPLSVVRPDVSLGNVESDSLNETSTRPCARRKRKFKRMAVDVDLEGPMVGRLPIGGGNLLSIEGGAAEGVEGHKSASVGGSGLVGGSVVVANKIRFGSCQENFRANLFFCGKRKRSHRDRYDYDHHRQGGGHHHHHHHHHNHHHHYQHSSSVPRQREMFTSLSSTGNRQNSYLECINRSRAGGNNSGGGAAAAAKIQPLNKKIISKIEKIAQDSHFPTATAAAAAIQADGPLRVLRPDCEFKPIQPAEDLEEENTMMAGESAVDTRNHISIPGAVQGVSNKSGSLESNFSFQEYGSGSGNSVLGGIAQTTSSTTITTTTTDVPGSERSTKRHHTRRHHRHKRSAMRMPLQFDDPSSFMDCQQQKTCPLDILSSSSLSSSDSETDKSCDSDREGDDELTDWPGNEGSMAFSGTADFKRTKSQKMSQKGGGLPLIKSDDTQDDDTRMSAEEVRDHSCRMLPVVLPLKPGFVPVTVPLPSVTPPGFLNRATPSLPIDMPMGGTGGGGTGGGGGGAAGSGGSGPQIESELSGETSNHFLSSPNALNDVREFRAGCRRVREERPSFSVITSVNEDLSRFLQDGKQTQLQLPDSDAEKLSHLAKLYSLHMRVDSGMAILTKTSNTTQPVRVDRTNMSKRYLSDFKRRCYEESGGDGGPASAMMTCEEQEMNDIQS